MLWKGMYAGEVGVPRLLRLFDKYNIKATWFIPGAHSSDFHTLTSWTFNFPLQAIAWRLSQSS